MAGSLGVALVWVLNNGDDGVTEIAASLLGPFWRMNSPHTENGIRARRPASRGGGGGWSKSQKISQREPLPAWTPSHQHWAGAAL